MLKNYFKIAFRNLIKNKSYAFISIFGMVVGLAVCILLFLYVQNELSYDSFNEKADSIYRLCQAEHPYHSPQTAKLLADNLPEIKEYARILPTGQSIITFNNKRFKEEEIVFADASLFKIFSFKFKNGILEEALQKPFTIVISENIAHKYFGYENPIGKVVEIDNISFTVSSVMEEMPQNSHFRFDIIASLTEAEKVFGEEWMNMWGWENFLVYFYMPNQFSQSTFEKKCTQIVLEHRNFKSGEIKPDYSIQKLSDIHLYSSRFANDIQPQNSITYVLIFSAIGFLILLIACFNYINILTANATTRLKEIGIRKVVGASRKHLSMQFLGESVLIIMIALILSLIVVRLFLPVFNSLSGKLLSFTDLIQFKSILGIFGIVIFTALLAGFYPSLFLSSIQPVKTFKASAKMNESKLNFRKVLVVLQFVIVIILITSAIFMFNQINFIQNKKLGFNKEYVLTAEAQQDFGDIEKYDAFKQVLLKESYIKNVTCASRIPSNTLTNFGAIIPPGKTEWIRIPVVHVANDYFETLGIKTVQGRLFSSNLKTDTANAIILNKAAVKEIGLVGDPIGQQIASVWPLAKREIVGVIDDLNFESLHSKIQPTMFLIYPRECNKLLIKVRSSNAESTINRLQAICNSFYPEQIFEFHFLDTKLDLLYLSDKNTFQLMGYFTALAVIIACMGLFGLALFMMRSRTKEIGIRKVLGASIISILISLTKDFTIWIIIAYIIALPVAIYGISKWLQNFAYRIDITIWPFILAGASTLFIALITVGYQAVKAALANPVKSLKAE